MSYCNCVYTYSIKFSNTENPVSTNSHFETSVAANGCNFTFNCTRSCGLHIVDMWSLELQDSDPFIITGKYQQEIFENKTGVTLTLTNTENEGGCDENVVDYSLSIWNTTRSIEGLTVRYGILKNDTQDTCMVCFIFCEIENRYAKNSA